MIKLNELEKRYDIVRSGLYSRLKKMQIKPTRVGRNACLSEEQVALLDRLDGFLSEGGTISEFLTKEGIQEKSPTSQSDVLKSFRSLEEAHSQGWLLSSSQLAALLESSKSVLELKGCEFCDGGFYFRQEGQRLNGEIAWRVSKPIQCAA